MQQCAEKLGFIPFPGTLNVTVRVPDLPGLQRLADAAVAGIEEAGGKAQVFGTPTISDGMAMGTEGMKYSLVSREVIADCIETCVGGQWMDGVVVVGGCDKNMPGGMMGMLRANVPGIFVYGGTILPGHYQGKDLNIVSVFEAVGELAAGRMNREDFHEVECRAIPGPGSCGGMYTANTMASAIEALGMSLPGSSAQDAISGEKLSDCEQAGRQVLELLKRDIKPSDIMTKKAFENSIRVVIALGGSTNAVIHLLAIAGRTGVALTLEDWDRVVAIDLKGTFLLCKGVIGHMRAQKSGRIVNFASIAGKDGNPNSCAYTASKAGVIAFTRGLALEVAQENIFVNSIAPTMIEGKMSASMTDEQIQMLFNKIPMKRFGKPDEVAALVRFLVSEECSFSTGACYDISGGRAVY